MSMKTAEIHTKYGVMKAKFFATNALGTVVNFVKLAKLDFSEGPTFHRVILSFVAQGRCPNGIDNSNSGYKIPRDLNDDNQYYDLSLIHI